MAQVVSLSSLKSNPLATRKYRVLAPLAQLAIFTRDPSATTSTGIVVEMVGRSFLIVLVFFMANASTAMAVRPTEDEEQVNRKKKN